MPKMPKWVTPNRQSYLVKLWLDYGNKCLLGHNVCPIAEHYIYHKPIAVGYTIPIIMRLFDLKELEAIRNWVADDRITASLQWEVERKALHSLAQRTYPLHGQFSGVSRDIYHDSQPIFYIEGYALSGITLKPFVKVKLASSYMRLHINLGDTLKHLSKNKRRKIVRYHKGGLPLEVQAEVDKVINEAVRQYRLE